MFAALTLYPLDNIAADRKEFLQGVGADQMSEPLAKVTSSLDYAEKHKLPRRYVDLLFRWERFDELYAHYGQLR